MPNPYLILAVVVAFILNGFYWHANGVNSENTRWKAKTEQQRADAENAARTKEQFDRQIKDKADAENKRTTSRLRADIARLRDTSSGAGGLSNPTPASSGAVRACFDPTKLDTALRVLNQDLLGIVEGGSQAVIDLDSAKSWAKDYK